MVFIGFWFYLYCTEKNFIWSLFMVIFSLSFFSKHILMKTSFEIQNYHRIVTLICLGLKLQGNKK